MATDAKPADGKPTLQHLNNSQSQQILWLLEELEIDYNLNLFERHTSGPKKSRAPDTLKETHPLGKSPQLITPEGRVIVERAAIAYYLVDKYDKTGRFKLNPTDTNNDVIREEELISFGNASLYPAVMTQLVFDMLRKQSPFFVRPLTGGIASLVNKAFLNQEITSMLKYLDDQLEGRDYLLGTKEPTRVDFLTHWPIDLGQQSSGSAVELDKYPRLKDWWTRCNARPAWKRAIEKGNGYDLNAF